MKVMCILTNGFEELEAVGTIALLRRAGVHVDMFTLDEKSATGRFQITIANILPLHLADSTSYDCLFLPGGPHYQALEKDMRVIEILDFFMKHDKIVAAICAAPTILGRKGYLKKKKYTCFTSMNEDFGGTYVDTYTVQDGNLITGKSAAAVIDFAFVLLERLIGTEKTKEVKEAIYYQQ